MLLPAVRRGELTDVRALLAAVCCAKGEIEQNLAAHLELLARAAAAGCDLVLFPEMSLTGSVDPAAHPERLIGLDHPAVAALAGATGETGAAACFGVAERSPDGRPQIAQVFAAAGRAAGVQRKRHLGEGRRLSPRPPRRWSSPGGHPVLAVAPDGGDPEEDARAGHAVDVAVLRPE